MTRVGVDVGGTRIKLAEVEQDGKTILRSLAIDTPATEGPVKVYEAIAAAVKQLTPAPKTLGLAIPGEVDASGKCVRLPNIPGFEGEPIAAELARRTGAQVVVENDATTAAYAELLFGFGQKYPSFLMVTLGTGIGGGVVIDRRLVRGKYGFAGEIGHVTVDSSEGAPRCGCGNHGCIEAFAGTHALLANFRKAGSTANEIKDVADSARRGEPAGLGTFAIMTKALAIGLNSIQNVLDLDAIVFTGGISKSFDLLEPAIRAGLRARRFAPPLSELPLAVSELDEHAGVIGAAYLPDLAASTR